MRRQVIVRKEIVPSLAVSTSVADDVEKHTGGAGFDDVCNAVGSANLANSFASAALSGHVQT